jgi:hypothetical protein
MGVFTSVSEYSAFADNGIPFAEEKAGGSLHLRPSRMDSCMAAEALSVSAPSSGSTPQATPTLGRVYQGINHAAYALPTLVAGIAQLAGAIRCSPELSLPATGPPDAGSLAGPRFLSFCSPTVREHLQMLNPLSMALLKPDVVLPA